MLLNCYEYTLKDHLGNSRVTFADIDQNGVIDETDILETNHYYPFGMLHEPRGTITNTNNYKYNGKELNEDFGLNWSDYGARWYDASIARWSAVDPLAEKYQPFSPYNYVLNNPVILIDPDGEYVDVGSLLKNDNGTLNVQGLHILVSTILELEEISGLEIGVENNRLTIEGSVTHSNMSKTASTYLSKIITNKSKAIDFKQSFEGRFTSTSKPSAILLDLDKIESDRAATKAAGIGTLTRGYGMMFIHESLHTTLGTEAYFSTTGQTSSDVKKKYGGEAFNGVLQDPEGEANAATSTGVVVDFVNQIRGEKGVSQRTSYGETEGYLHQTVKEYDIMGREYEVDKKIKRKRLNGSSSVILNRHKTNPKYNEVQGKKE